MASALSAIVMAGALSTFYLLTRTGYRSAAYAEMASDLRNGLDHFTRDVRLAADLRWVDARRVVLLVPGADGRVSEISYGYEVAAPGAASGRFYRETADADGRAVRATLADSIAPDFAFARYRLPSGDAAPAPAANDLETRLLELNLRAVRANPAGAVVSQTARSTRALLRNKLDTR